MKVCQITGKKPMSGNNVSHSKSRTRRRFLPNLIVKKFFLEEENRFITLKVSAKGLRTISKKGLGVALKDALLEGHIEKY